MCLAIPGKLLKKEEGVHPAMGLVSFGGIQKRVCLEWVPEVAVGDYVVVHVGFAISTMNESEALETLQFFEQADEASLNELSDDTPKRRGPDEIRR